MGGGRVGGSGRGAASRTLTRPAPSHAPARPPAQTVTIERPLPLEMRLGWNPTLSPDEASIHDVGVEGLTIEFAHRPYLGHHHVRAAAGLGLLPLPPG